jgi:hypothetical protein
VALGFVGPAAQPVPQSCRPSGLRSGSEAQPAAALAGQPEPMRAFDPSTTLRELSEGTAMNPLDGGLKHGGAGWRCRDEVADEPGGAARADPRWPREKGRRNS